MSGFVKAYGSLPGCNVSQSHNVMKCFSPEKIPILTTLAQEYAICDAWFSSVPGPTLPNRSYAHAATSMGRLDMNPIWFNEGKTIYELLAESKISSKIYFHDATVAMTFKNFLQNQKFFEPWMISWTPATTIPYPTMRLKEDASVSDLLWELELLFPNSNKAIH
jgi:phospholipase C